MEIKKLENRKDKKKKKNPLVSSWSDHTLIPKFINLLIAALSNLDRFE